MSFLVYRITHSWLVQTKQFVTIIAAEPRISETTSHTGADDVHPWAGRAVMTKIQQWLWRLEKRHLGIQVNHGHGKPRCRV